MTLNSVALSLGSNLGDKQKNINTALDLLSDKILIDLRYSDYFSSKAFDFPIQAYDFLNIAVTGKTSLSPLDLLTCCQEIEVMLRRPRNHGFRENRTIDIDIILFNNLNIETPVLTIPHPKMFHRDFVLIPLAEVAPDWKVPPSEESVSYFLAEYNKAKPERQSPNTI